MSGTAVSVDVVIPTYGNAHLTIDCLTHLSRQTVPCRVIVVDDASPDDSARRVRERFPDVEIIERAVNGGFAAACNDGIRVGSGDVVVLVNNDVDAAPDLLERLVEPFRRDARLGSAAPLLLRPDGCVDAYGLCADGTLAGFVRAQGADPDGVGEGSHRLLGPYGAVAAFRRAALDEVGLLDERIFMYGEELDLALRLSAAGWGTIGVSAARGVHLGGATAGRGSATQRRRAGFGRGYLLRAYGVLRSRYAARAVATEALVCLADLALSRDTASLRGRVAGWRAARDADPRPRTIPGLDEDIGFLTSMRMRWGGVSAAGEDGS